MSNYNGLTTDEKWKVDQSLSLVDSVSKSCKYYKDPLKEVCKPILLREVFDRLAFYGVQNNIKKLLREEYSLNETACNSCVLLSNGLVYFSSLISAIISDSFLGPYSTIVIFSVAYLAGLTLLVVAAIPGFQSLWIVYLSLFGLFAIGAGGIKSCVPVLGGQQFSAVDQKDQLSSFFVSFYKSINGGALLGGISIPILIQLVGISYAFILPLASLAISMVIFINGSSKYVKVIPEGSAVVQIWKALCHSICRFSLQKCKRSNGGSFDDHFIDDAKILFSLIPVFVIAIPFHNANDQIYTLFETQSEKMNSSTFGWHMPAQMMSNMDSLVVIIGAYLFETFLFPYLRSINKFPTVMQKFAIGYTFAALSNFCACIVELAILSNQEPRSVSIWNQTAQFSLIAIGEVFLLSTAYEVAYTFAPESLKSVASSFNLIAISLASYVKVAFIHLCKPWMENNQYSYIYCLMAAICLLFATLTLVFNIHFEHVFAHAKLHNNRYVNKCGALDSPVDHYTLLQSPLMQSDKYKQSRGS